ncbi:MAG: tRNA pseudouridine synthase B [Alphaproteobacteria bacterium MarineAlpha5_Bin12]|nr:tRNA pseudouridine(55) synthase TruB [Pelagibacteraceae bacterium]PPR41175.1 MAG: tRNA pseudouridine synthase B [Alphaproteobacteria bacterium MarineAlpha5_Bin12]|tara:strand:- start:10846 stop:11757 length:912 start_codon:yes stop_codon:yes gene_type:complete
MSKINTGWLNIYKPINITSSKAVLKIKKKFNLKKIGHAGTLDPKAEGILPIAIGSTTRIINFIEKKKKIYQFIIKWGEQTNTDDSEGEVIYFSKNYPQKKEIEKILPNYLGTILQKPPIFSAIKISGNRAYDLSRKKIQFDLKDRKVEIFAIKLLKTISKSESLFSITCGKGFYIRSFARDIAIKLGTRGHIKTLKRQEVGIFNEKNSILLDDLLKIGHLSPEIKGYFKSTVMLDDIPAFNVNDREISEIQKGKEISISNLEHSFSNEVKTENLVYAQKNKEVVALGYIENNFFKPKKVLYKE